MNLLPLVFRFALSLALCESGQAMVAQDLRSSGPARLELPGPEKVVGSSTDLLAAGSMSQQAYLKSTNTGSMDTFGNAVAVSGNTAVVGAELEGGQTGAAYVFLRTGSTWQAQARLQASNAEPGDFFGRSVAISGDTIIVGAYGEDSNAAGVNGDQLNNSASISGAAYVFLRTGTAWNQEAYLKASNPGSVDSFGISVDIAGDRLVVGAITEDSAALGVNGNQLDNSASNSGAAYVFVRIGATWMQEAYLKASNTETDDWFGYDVSISGDTIAVGVHREDSDAVGVDGDQLNNHADGAGAVYVFVRSPSGWSQQAYVKASNTKISNWFGYAVDVDSDTLLVGCPLEKSTSTGVNGDQSNNNGVSGAAYVFARSGTNWAQQAFIKASNTGISDDFGISVALSGDTAIIGAYREDSPADGINGDQRGTGSFDMGAAYVYQRSGTSWSQLAYVKASNSDFGDNFGWSADLSGSTAIVGARHEDSGATGVDGDQNDESAQRAGAAYAFELQNIPVQYCSAKASSSGCLAVISTSRPGAQPVSGTADYAVTATAVQELKNGILFAGISGAAALPFNGGTLCVQPPTKRGPIISSGGMDPLGCAGALSTVVNDGLVIPLGLDGGPGNTAWYQYWYRDPANGAGQLGSALSNAVRLDFQ